MHDLDDVVDAGTINTGIDDVTEERTRKSKTKTLITVGVEKLTRIARESVACEDVPELLLNVIAIKSHCE